MGKHRDGVWRETRQVSIIDLMVGRSNLLDVKFRDESFLDKGQEQIPWGKLLHNVNSK